MGLLKGGKGTARGGGKKIKTILSLIVLTCAGRGHLTFSHLEGLNVKSSLLRTDCAGRRERGDFSLIL